MVNIRVERELKRSHIKRIDLRQQGASVLVLGLLRWPLGEKRRV